MSINVELLRKAERLEELFGDRPVRIRVSMGSGATQPECAAGEPAKAREPSFFEENAGEVPRFPSSGGEELWRRLAEYVLHSRASGMQASIGISTIHRGESAARVVATLGRCVYSMIDSPLLLVESSFSKPSLAAIYGVPESPGMTDLLLSPKSSLSGCIHHVPGKDLWVLPAGGRADTTRARDWNGNFAAVHRKIAAAFRHTIFELPCAAEKDYSLDLYPLTGRIVLVVNPSAASADGRNRVARRFDQAGIEPLATVPADPGPIPGSPKAIWTRMNAEKRG